jgi:hypothetical protein
MTSARKGEPMPSVERSGVVVRYEVDGDGFPLVLLHGLSVDAASWRRAVGYADDAIIVALILRSVTRAAGTEALDRHWPGTPEGLGAVKRLAAIAT